MSSNMSRNGKVSIACNGVDFGRHRQDIETGEFIYTTPVSKLSEVVDVLEDFAEGIEIAISPPLSEQDIEYLRVAKELAFRVPIVAKLLSQDGRWNFSSDLQTLAAHGVEKIVLSDPSDANTHNLKEINRVQRLGLSFLS